MNVLSLFDGMSCGQIALNRLGINYDKYFASEIDKYAIQVTQHNFPDTIQLGDVQFVTKDTFGNHKIDLLIGGSPCQGFSFAGKQLNFDDPRSKLFFEFVRLLRELNPKYFLLENVRMKKESQDIITEYLGVEPIFIDSALVSAQTRKRLYWTNIPNVGQPEDKGIVLKDIIEASVRDEYTGTHGYANGYVAHEINPSKPNQINPDRSAKSSSDAEKGTQPHMQDRVFHEDGKSHALTASFANRTNVGKFEDDVKGGAVRGRYNEDGKTEQRLEVRKDDKTNSITTVQKDSVVVDRELAWRKLTPLECERLQTVPDGYTLVLDENGKQLVSDTQRYKMLGNGWTVDVIAHILKNMDL